jgi:surfactin synthase thioesterase subunit
MTAFAGRDDDIVTPSLVDAWREQTIAPFRCQMFSGGHFFVAQHAREIVSMIARALR